jgi:tRNA wybutosine-synthesizing protein 1
MENVPWHEEVKNYALHLCETLGGDYGIAAEHRHSCCMLLAKKNPFFVNNQWHTWIDYEKYNELITEYYKSGKTFTSEQYMAPTPHWAVYGAVEQGFSPFGEVVLIFFIELHLIIYFLNICREALAS